MARVRSAAAVTNMVNGALGLVGTLVELAEPDEPGGDDCRHPLDGVLSADCVRCQARRGLAAIRERAAS